MNEEIIYVPYIPITNSTYINGIRVWDRRWYINIFCRLNWFFHFKTRKRFKELSKRKVTGKYYIID